MLSLSVVVGVSCGEEVVMLVLSLSVVPVVVGAPRADAMMEMINAANIQFC